jgi:hypothetical protein
MPVCRCSVSRSRTNEKCGAAVCAPPVTTSMHIDINLGAWSALFAGVLILVAPRLLSTIVALYLIFIGVTGLMHLH